MQQREPLCTTQAAAKERHARQIALRSVEAGDETHLHRIFTDDEHERYGRAGNPHCRQHRRRVADDHGRLPADQIGGETRQPIRLIVPPTLLDDDIAAFDEPFLTQPFGEFRHEVRKRRGARAAKKTDHRHRRLLRPRRDRPRRRRAAEQRDELAASHHSITSSARASSVGGMSRPSALAVLKLMTNSNLVGCTTGKSAGLAPLRILPAYLPTWRYTSGRSMP